MNLNPIILASGSPRRRELMALLNQPFEVITSHAPESAPEHMTPGETCQLNAYRKARAVAKQHPDAIVIGADTEVARGLEVFGKPGNRRDAEAMLGRLQGRSHRVITGVCILHLRQHRQTSFAEFTRVRFHRLSPSQRKHYLDSIDPLDKAGAYAIQENGHQIVESIEGSFSNVVGLPVSRLAEELEAFISPGP